VVYAVTFPKGEGYAMPIERDHAAERNARVEELLSEAKRTAGDRAPTDGAGTREMFSRFDDMLAELDATNPVRLARPATTRNGS
jgi:hypothetical protein